MNIFYKELFYWLLLLYKSQNIYTVSNLGQGPVRTALHELRILLNYLLLSEFRFHHQQVDYAVPLALPGAGQLRPAGHALPALRVR